MTIDIARADHNATIALGTSSDALVRLGQWVDAARNAHALVAPLIDTAFVPDAYKPRIDPRATPEQKAEARSLAINNATAAVLQGLSLGVDPMVSMQQIYIIHGRPGMYAKFMVALVQSRGHEVWTEDISDTRAVVCGRRKGAEHIERVVITMEMARKAKWTSNAKYQETPQDMLWARAASRVCDRIASDVLKGIASVEEIQDTVQTTAEVGTGQRTVAPRRRAQAIEATANDDGPPLEDGPAPAADNQIYRQTDEAWAEEVAAPPEAETAVEPAADAPPAVERPAGSISAAQQRMLHALLRDTNRSDRDIALVYISGVLGREVESTKELSKADAGKVIDAMSADTAGPALDEDADGGA